jgi:hypothetical protein
LESTRSCFIGETFRDLAKAYLVSGLEKGVPSLFVDVKSVYVDGEKMRIVGEIVESLITQLEGDFSIHDDGELPLRYPARFDLGLTRL